MKSKRVRINFDEPFYLVYRIFSEANTPGVRFLDRCFDIVNVNPLDKITEAVREKAQGATKPTNYNTNVTEHPIYTNKVFIPDYKRESCTRLHIMSNNLRGWEVEPHTASGTCVLPV